MVYRLFLCLENANVGAMTTRKECFPAIAVSSLGKRSVLLKHKPGLIGQHSPDPGTRVLAAIIIILANLQRETMLRYHQPAIFATLAPCSIMLTAWDSGPKKVLLPKVQILVGKAAPFSSHFQLQSYSDEGLWLNSHVGFKLCNPIWYPFFKSTIYGIAPYSSQNA
jgi:hypothetical protein